MKGNYSVVSKKYFALAADERIPDTVIFVPVIVEFRALSTYNGENLFLLDGMQGISLFDCNSKMSSSNFPMI